MWQVARGWRVSQVGILKAIAKHLGIDKACSYIGVYVACPTILQLLQMCVTLKTLFSVGPFKKKSWAEAYWCLNVSFALSHVTAIQLSYFLN